MATIDPAVGHRVESLRRRAGLSREKLAKRAGISPSLIKFVEGGTRALTLRVAQRIAPHLGVRDLGELYGPNMTLTLDPRSPAHPSVPAVRAALTAWPLHIEGAPASPDYLRGAVDMAWRTWHTSSMQRTEVAELLPGLLGQAGRAARLHEGADRRRSLALLAECYHLAQWFLAYHGDGELVWLCADRGMSCALDSDDPVAMAQATRWIAYVLRCVGRSDEALLRLSEGAALLEPFVNDPDPIYAATLAAVHLTTAITYARMGDEAAWASWQTARDLIHRVLPADHIDPYTRVGRVVLEMDGVMCAVDLGDSDRATRRAQSLDPATIPSTERRARHLIELARAAEMDGSQEATLHLLTRATAISPEVVRYSQESPDLVRRLATNANATIRADAELLARSLSIDPP